MNNEEIKTPVVTPEEPAIALSEAPVETPVETPVEAPSEAPVVAPVETPVEAPSEAPVVAPVATPVRAPINPHKYFLLSNIFRTITVALLIVCTILAMYLPVFKVNAADGTFLEDLGVDDEATVSFSLMDVISDLGDEFKLCFTLDPLEDPEDLEEYLEIYKNPGKFTLALDATAIANRANTSPLADLVKSFEDTRILLAIPYFLLIMPVIFIIGLAISALIRLIQVIIGWIKPSTQLKKTDASSCLVVTIFMAICYLIHFFYSCFTVDFVFIGILAVVSIGAIVMNFVYRKHTKDIVDAQFGL